MNVSSFLNIRWVLGALFALILAGTAYGFAASNTVPTSGAGDGAGAISGYTVGGITYVLNATDPSLIDTVDFTITPAGTNSQPTTVKVQVIAGGTWYTATHGSGTAWSLDLSSANVTALSVDSLRVVAAQ
ncbi:hypothetical protein F8S13_11705 [Chloroflexia bacterium SDU3-3]|nr:hypothetical protein F8S13_11705 [Chloroflexia bacterium SDU3-3]